MPGWIGSDRRDTLPRNWESEIVPRILERDGRRCQHVRFDTGFRCGRFANEVDHIVNHKQGGTDADSNLQALCHFHHLQKSGAEGGRASQAARRYRHPASKPYKHPGLL